MIKLVRDRIPEIVKKSNLNFEFRAARPEERLTLLKRKLMEEVGEFLAGSDLEELADILEVVRALGRELGLDWQALDNLRNSKQEERGGFAQLQVLVSR